MEYQVGQRRALLAGVCSGREHDFQVGMDELAALAFSCGFEPVRRVMQHLPWTDKATCAGPGKVEEIRDLADAEEADLVIFNNSLSPAQIANLTKLLDVEVLDRTALILQIFAQHASTKEARIQVEYARLQYTLPRLVGLRRNLSRQGGGSGSLSNRGSGEMQIELDRRHIERRMSVLRRELAKISTIRETQRRKRTRERLPLVSMVGYTNAGKSTLMNALIDSCERDLRSDRDRKPDPDMRPDALWSKRALESNGSVSEEDLARENSRHVYVKDMVFATLDTAVRRIAPEGMQPFLLSDTVGFINDLPTFLVEAFQSTLEEVVKADLILEVVDASDPEHGMQMEVTQRTLQELGAGGIPRIRVMNKADLTDRDIQESTVFAEGKNTEREKAEKKADGRNTEGKKAGESRIYLSAKHGDGIDALIHLIEEKLNGETIEETLLIPYTELAISEPLRRIVVILSEEYTQEGLKLKVRMDLETLRRYREYLTD